jgi:hypothetical protein
MELSRSLAAVASWSVTYDGEVYEDARNWLGVWYFRASPGGTFRRFAHQDNVHPVCTNSTRNKKPLAG